MLLCSCLLWFIVLYCAAGLLVIVVNVVGFVIWLVIDLVWYWLAFVLVIYNSVVVICSFMFFKFVKYFGLCSCIAFIV